MKTSIDINRREFIKVFGVGGGSLLLGIYLQGCKKSPSPTPAMTTSTLPATARPEATATLRPTTAPELTATLRPTAEPTPTATPEPVASVEPTSLPGASAWLEPNIYLNVADNGLVTITAFRSEMGQGVRTAIAMIIAEELDADWSTVYIQQAPADSAYGDQVTGGSQSISRHYNVLRAAGATARYMLLQAAAQTWGVAPESCSTESGWVIHNDSERRLSYGELVSVAATLPVPDTWDLPLKDPQDFRIIGAQIGQWDAPQMEDGSAVYGLDVQLPGMLYAVVARCPVFGGRIASFDANPALAVAGVRQVLEIDSGIAVVAESTWAALQGRQALGITWDEGSRASLNSADIRQARVDRAPTRPAGSSSELEAAYDIPYLAHATLEPMNCTADVRADSCQVWAPTQNPQEAQRSARRACSLPAEAVQVHVPLIGGGFGRRLEVDYVKEAVQISQAVGAPVKLTWTRDDDMQHDFYHPLSYSVVYGSLDNPSQVNVRSMLAERDIPTGAWRSVGNFTKALPHECFVDELAVELGRDPVELRLELLSGRARAVVELAAAQAGWGEPLPEGWGRGIAYHATFGVTHVAQVAEVSVSQAGQVRVQRVVCAVDCGLVINPDAVRAQMEGGIAFALTAVLKAAITVENGRVQQSNFHDYPLLRMDEMPVVEVHIVPSERSPSGIGEMGVPPLAPAVLNAVFNATGKRIRRIPLRAEDLM